MNSRISLSNWLLPISFTQFQTIVSEFQKLAAAAFGIECTIQIRALRSNKVSPTRMHESGVMDYIDRQNARAVFFESYELADMTAEVFKSAAYVEVIVSPMNILAAPRFAFAHVEFKGKFPRQAAFYLQPGDPNDFKALQFSHPHMRSADRYEHNCSYG